MPLNDRKPRFSDESGFSLIQVLVSIGVLSVCIFLFFQAKQVTQKARKSVDSVAMVTDVNEALVAELSTIIRQVDDATANCLDYAGQINNRPFSKSSGTSALTFSTAINNQAGFSDKLTAKEKTKLNDQLNSETYKGVVNRCRSPHRPTSGTDAADDLFYLCMTIKQDTTAPAGSFLNAPYAFAEVGWQLINLQTGANMSCADFKASAKAAGARVFYAVYWAVPVGGDMTLKKHINSFTLGK